MMVRGLFWMRIMARVNLDGIGQMVRRVRAKNELYVEDSTVYERSRWESGELKRKIAKGRGRRRAIEAKDSGGAVI